MKYVWVAPEKEKGGGAVIARQSTCDHDLWYLAYQRSEYGKEVSIHGLNQVELDGLYEELERAFYSASNPVYSLCYGVMMGRIKEMK